MTTRQMLRAFSLDTPCPMRRLTDAELLSIVETDGGADIKTWHDDPVPAAIVEMKRRSAIAKATGVSA